MGRDAKTWNSRETGWELVIDLPQGVKERGKIKDDPQVSGMSLWDRCWHMSWEGDIGPSVPSALTELTSGGKPVMKHNYWKEEKLSFSVICIGRKQCGRIWVHVKRGPASSGRGQIREHLLNKVNFEGWTQSNMNRVCGGQRSWREAFCSLGTACINILRQKEAGWAHSVNLREWNSGAGGEGQEEAGKIGTRSWAAMFQTLS